MNGPNSSKIGFIYNEEDGYEIVKSVYPKKAQDISISNGTKVVILAKQELAETVRILFFHRINDELVGKYYFGSVNSDSIVADWTKNYFSEDMDKRGSIDVFHNELSRLITNFRLVQDQDNSYASRCCEFLEFYLSSQRLHPSSRKFHRKVSKYYKSFFDQENMPSPGNSSKYITGCRLFKKDKADFFKKNDYEEGSFYFDNVYFLKTTATWLDSNPFEEYELNGNAIPKSLWEGYEDSNDISYNFGDIDSDLRKQDDIQAATGAVLRREYISPKQSTVEYGIEAVVGFISFIEDLGYNPPDDIEDFDTDAISAVIIIPDTLNEYPIGEKFNASVGIHMHFGALKCVPVQALAIHELSQPEPNAILFYDGHTDPSKSLELWKSLKTDTQVNKIEIIDHLYCARTDHSLIFAAAFLSNSFPRLRRKFLKV